MREAQPNIDAAFMNGGGLRADLPAGELGYGALFESFPFDSRNATAKLSVKDLKAPLAAHIGRSGGILSRSGITLRAECGPKGGVEVELFDAKGKALKDERMLTIMGSDFMFLGGDAFWGDLTPPPIEIADELMRDALERGLKKRKELRSSDVFDAKKPRFKLKGKRPMTCRRAVSDRARATPTGGSSSCASARLRAPSCSSRARRLHRGARRRP